MSKPVLARLVKQHGKDLLAGWLDVQRRNMDSARGVIDSEQLDNDCGTFLRKMAAALERSQTCDIAAEEWQETTDFLADLSRSRARQGFTPSETAQFVLSLKQPLFDRLRAETEDATALAQEVAFATELIDKLGLYTTEVFQKSREDVIERQQLELLELSTPVISLWEGILAVPLIGTLDSARTQVVMESLLEEVVRGEASIAVIDITGVPTVDTLVAQHLLKTVAAARLMGAECVISGIRPQIAQTIVHLGVDLGEVVTKASLADALRYALEKRGLRITSIPGGNNACHG